MSLREYEYEFPNPAKRWIHENSNRNKTTRILSQNNYVDLRSTRKIASLIKMTFV